jgi:hypothetical protein
MLNRMYVLPNDEPGEGFYRRIFLLIKKSRPDRTSAGAAFGLAAGLLSIAAGALLWAVVSLLTPSGLRSLLSGLETLFFVLPIPLLSVGACCLDILEKRPPLLPLRGESGPAVSEVRRRFRPQRPHLN